MDAQTNYINDFEKTFMRDKDGKFDISNTSQIMEWYSNHMTIVSHFEGVRNPASPLFSENQKQNDDVIRSLYLFGIRYYNELIENRDNL